MNISIIKSLFISILIFSSLSVLSAEDIKKDKDISKINSAAFKFFDKPSSMPAKYLENDSLIISFCDVYVEKCHINEIEDQFFLFNCCFKNISYETEPPKYCYIEDLKQKLLCYKIYAIDKENDIVATLLYLKKKDGWKLMVVKFNPLDTD